MKLAPKAVVGRVSLYLRQLEAYQRQGCTTVSSSQLGDPLSIKNAQVRKDLAFFGQFGHPGIGYRIDELIDALRHILGIDHDWPLALIGLGNLGRALLNTAGSGLAASTSSRSSTTTEQDRPGLRRHDRRAARGVAQGRRGREDRLAILRAGGRRPARGGPPRRLRHPRHPQFRPLPLVVPPQVNLVGVDLSIQLENLAYKVQKTQGEVSLRQARATNDQAGPGAAGRTSLPASRH